MPIPTGTVTFLFTDIQGSTQLASFIGREEELKAIMGIVKEGGRTGGRLLTLLGLGGAGKTRLALQAAAELIEGFPDGAWFVDLPTLTDGTLLPYELAATWGLREPPVLPIQKILSDCLPFKALLLVLDNCEYLADGVARSDDFTNAMIRRTI
jgi:predicted ATPase